MNTTQMVMLGVCALFGLSALVIVWAYIIDALRGAKMPEYKKIRAVVNLLFTIALMLLVFLVYNHKAEDPLFLLSFYIHGGCWVFTFLASLIAWLCVSNDEHITKPILAAMWKVLACLWAMYALPL